ncbi:GATA zinc finger domain-containing protein 10-like [Panonychus citri]|uniref:GATA zinc finger domain-containing protein 10-like n=1 Tax=Panonychus citri TaxID=50023 RepID=UPI002307B3A2|nr:GATA zinc finger domain-containing protein 10-like [Panonychus citri]
MNFDLFSSHLVHSPSPSLDVNMSFYCESPAAIINNQVHLIPENHHNRNRVNNLTYRDPMYSSIPAIPSILNRPVNNQSTNCLPYNHHHHHHPHLNVSTSPLVYNQQQRFQHHLNHPNQYYNLNYQSYQQQQQQQQQTPQQYHPHHPHHLHRPHQYPKQFGDNDNFQIYHNINQQQFNYNESPMDANNLGINCVQVEKTVQVLKLQLTQW